MKTLFRSNNCKLVPKVNSQPCQRIQAQIFQQRKVESIPQKHIFSDFFLCEFYFQSFASLIYVSHFFGRLSYFFFLCDYIYLAYWGLLSSKCINQRVQGMRLFKFRHGLVEKKNYLDKKESPEKKPTLILKNDLMQGYKVLPDYQKSLILCVISS